MFWSEAKLRIQTNYVTVAVIANFILRVTNNDRKVSDGVKPTDVIVFTI